jgi:hypothetical protein
MTLDEITSIEQSITWNIPSITQYEAAGVELHRETITTYGGNKVYTPVARDCRQPYKPQLGRSQFAAGILNS